MRDEAHRFGITFHRAKRSKGTFKTELDTIKGIGETTVTLLLNTFKSVNNVRTASVEELTKVVGESKAMLVKKALKDAEI